MLHLFVQLHAQRNHLNKFLAVIINTKYHVYYNYWFRKMRSAMNMISIALE